MLLNIQGSEFSHNTFNEIELLTSKSYLILNSINYSKDKCNIEFIIERYRIKKIGKKMFALIDIPEYDLSGKIRSLVKIKSVVDMKMKNNFKSSIIRFQILRGLYVRNHEICIYSVEEDHGVHLFSMELSLNELNFSFMDI